VIRGEARKLLMEYNLAKDEFLRGLQKWADGDSPYPDSARLQDSLDKVLTAMTQPKELVPVGFVARDQFEKFGQGRNCYIDIFYPNDFNSNSPDYVPLFADPTYEAETETC
jgi:hypothetical protein